MSKSFKEKNIVGWLRTRPEGVEELKKWLKISDLGAN